ncbi:1,4-dihydroxy-2-naphthoate polyprenyltransferase [Companilactobacillus halodurans]|uniref:1,4-dihydroxy-2-naphthoate polyprenyltransferase n=1 Tax=Companilactobacillus halodurans TaxID=2584183 RepID=A0A5P0ZR85_9LACO|nr:1,4-dihydroxy-2-naphthoate polyprenyltransferase [Companilactobacillus halodurans]MQS97855.1 1,4-dihydroxy-2-naphthoate polyprenyltransferase [Companilactobacillus halodurans]
MKPSVFFELVEIKAKTASVFPFLMGTLYSYYHWHSINALDLTLFFVAMFLFNMAVDINDNYWDYKNATGNDSFRRKTNVIGVNHLNIHLIGFLDLSFSVIAAVIGLWIVSRTGLVLLGLGLFSFLVGFCYAGGPWPINRGPFGEFFSGFTMGYVIYLIAIYINVVNNPVVVLNAKFYGDALLSSLLTVFSISNLLLANNIADQEEDLNLGRKTLVYYLGKANCIFILKSLYALGYLALICSVILGLLPKLMLLTILITPIVYKNAKAFSKNPIKKKTFPLIIKNLLLITLTQTLTFFLGVIFNF